jgi:predicted nucleic acid-binding protein
MILADSVIWADHIRKFDQELAVLVDNDQILMHPHVVGEIALGSLKDRTLLIERLNRLPAAPVARDSDVLMLIEANALYSTGIGYVDAHLLASVRLLPGAVLWTRDKRLHKQAERLGIASQL